MKTATKEIVNFRRWLSANGAELLLPTNVYELARFKANGQVSVVYRSKRTTSNLFPGYSFTGEALGAFTAFKSSGPWRNGKAERKKMSNCNIELRGHGMRRKSVLVRTLIERDGGLCFYCNTPMQAGSETVEHLLSLTHGGSWHIENLALAHSSCNAEANHLGVVGKVRLRDRKINNGGG